MVIFEQLECHSLEQWDLENLIFKIVWLSPFRKFTVSEYK